MQNLVALSQTVNGLVAPPSWVEVIYVIPLYEVSRGLNLNLSSVGGRSLKLTDYYRAEARRYLPDRAKTEAETMRQSRGSKVETEARLCEAEARPSQLKNCIEAASSRGRCLEDSIPCEMIAFVTMMAEFAKCRTCPVNHAYDHNWYNLMTSW